MKKLSDSFIVELIKACLTDPKVFDICYLHVQYTYFPNKEQKEVYKYITDYYDIHGKCPTVGLISQSFGDTNKEVTSLLASIKKAIPPSSNELIATLEIFIKRTRFVYIFEKTGSFYTQGKQDEAIAMLTKEAQSISDFSIKDNIYTTVFKGFSERHSARQQKGDSVLLERVSFGIDEMDHVFRGGGRKGTSALVLARSGRGKSTFLRWAGTTCSRRGGIVVHFQGEGSEEECLEDYDACWTGTNKFDMEVGNIAPEKLDKIERARQNIINNKGEIYVYAAEQFDSFSIEKAREILQDVYKKHGRIDQIIFDYLEIFTVKGKYGNDSHSERKRRGDIADKMTDLAVEFKAFVVTATQANDIKEVLYNNNEYVMTRSDISEFKNMVKPFSMFFTFNQTDDEYDQGIMRIWCDKARRQKSNVLFKIYQNLSTGRFYDRNRTLKFFYSGEL